MSIDHGESPQNAMTKMHDYGVFFVAFLAALAVLLLSACSSSETEQSSNATTVTTRETALPSTFELQEVLNKAMDPNLPKDQYSSVVEDGEDIPQFFDVLQIGIREQKTALEVLEPVAEGLNPHAATATIRWFRENKEPQDIQGVEFIHHTSGWVLSLTWACTLATSAIPDSDPIPVCARAGE